MTDRHTASTINDAQLDALYERLDRIRDAAALHRQGLISTAELYAVIEAHPAPAPAEAPRLHALIAATIRDTPARYPDDIATAIVHVILPLTRTTTELARMSEADVSRVIELHERWVKAGPPPLGQSLSRWWDARLVELHNAILPPADQTEEQQ